MAKLYEAHYANRIKEESNVVLLEPDVAQAFPNDESVNKALQLSAGNSPEASNRQLGESSGSPGLYGIHAPRSYRCNSWVEPTELSAFPGAGPTDDAMIIEGLARKPGWGTQVKG